MPIQTGQYLWPERMNRLLIVRKTVDESVANNATLQDDDQLRIAVPPQTVWRFRLSAVHSTPASNLRVGMAGPLGCSFSRVKFEAGPTSAMQVGILPGGSNPSTGGITGTGTDSPVEISGVVEVGLTAGDVRFQWSQSGTNATPAIVRAGSFLELALID